jgi:hypothetical protein
MWTTWLERILGQRPANENTPVTERPADTVMAGLVSAAAAADVGHTAGQDEFAATPADEVMP